jgi:beta-glucuronidase
MRTGQPSSSRRAFLGGAAALSLPAAAAAAGPAPAPVTASVSLNGPWRFRAGPDQPWREVTVPHTWQVEPGLEEYYGAAEYRRSFGAPAAWRGQIVRLEFEAVYHTAEVALNGQDVGRHAGKGYTAFTIDLTRRLDYGGANELSVRVDNSFNESMLPRGTSSDWAHDGGIYRPVQLLVTPTAFIERAAIEAVPGDGAAAIGVTATVANRRETPLSATLAGRVIDGETGAAVLALPEAKVRLDPGASAEVPIPQARLDQPRLWHFDRPHLYRLELTLMEGGAPVHSTSEIFGVRSFEVRDGGFWLNGERIWPMGVERMAGSHPDYGMAEPESWIAHDHAGMKNLNCVFTRVHWPQDRRVLDWCDRHGMMVQLEVPAWGSRTFREKAPEPPAELMNNGLEQLRAMIARDRNHPCVVAWGLCNEVGGQNPPAYAFVKRMYEEAKKLDPRRPRTYASHTLFKTPGRDVSALMDFVSFNQYYGSWQKGTAADLRRNLLEIFEAFPGKPVVISEYGYCACTADRPEGDEQRIRILREHQAVFREFRQIAGLIFFSYNDYRTHIGDRGAGALKQRVHGVVDVYGRRKPSYEVLRDESSPVEWLEVEYSGGQARVSLAARKTQPLYTLRGYTLECVVYGQGGIPVERHTHRLPDLAPGAALRHEFALKEPKPREIRVEMRRFGGFSARSALLRP